MTTDEKKRLFWGILISCLLIFMFSVSGNIGSATKGPAIHNWSWIFKLALLIPGALLIISAFSPKSVLGKVGKSMYIFYLWVLRETKSIK